MENQFIFTKQKTFKKFMNKFNGINTKWISGHYLTGEGFFAYKDALDVIKNCGFVSVVLDLETSSIKYGEYIYNDGENDFGGDYLLTVYDQRRNNMLKARIFTSVSCFAEYIFKHQNGFFGIDQFNYFARTITNEGMLVFITDKHGNYDSFDIEYNSYIQSNTNLVFSELWYKTPITQEV